MWQTALISAQQGQAYVQGWTALMYACGRGHIETAKVLLAHGANASERSSVRYNKPEEVCGW